MKKLIENAQWHYKIGKEFEEAFYLLIGEYSPIRDHWSTQVGRPSYYCSGLAMEHYLKGYLILENIKFPTNHEGHNLDKLILLGDKKLKELFEFEEEDIKSISLLNERYYSHEIYGKDDLRYGSVSGLRISPHPDSFNRILKEAGVKLEADIRKRWLLLESPK